MIETERQAPSIRYESESGAAKLTIHNPSKMNAMTFEMWSSLPGLVERAVADDSVRVIAIGGSGGRAFCAGADISQFGEKRSDESAVQAYDRAVAAGNAALTSAAKPTVAIISGICFGGGFGLAMCCDLRIASSDSRFRVPAARLGLGYGFSNVELLVRKLGMGPASDLLLSARITDASEALRLGAVNSVFGADVFAEEASAYIERIAQNAPLTLLAIKRALVELMRREAERDVGAVNALVAACFHSGDYREGQAAFKEKRNPVFTGR
jgi:enoyl-CoA hydratase/carnithine racemase